MENAERARIYAEKDRSAGQVWEEQDRFLELISSVKGITESVAKEMGADFRFEISPPESIDGGDSSPLDLCFFISLRKEGFPASAYCLYSRLENRALRVHAGRYDAGKVTTIKELDATESLKNPAEALHGWLREVFWLSLGEKPDNA